MTTYVVPCGVSVLDELGKKIPGGGGSVTALVRSVKAGAWLDGTDLGRRQQVLSAWRGTVAGKADAARLAGALPKPLSAETHCLAGREAAVAPVTDGPVMLLASDTRAGISAAFCVGHYLTGGVVANLSYAGAPGPDGNPLQFDGTSAGVTIVRIPGLKPNLPDFNDAVTGIGTVLRAAWEAGGPVEVHLSGGFKATLLHTLAMTEVLHSLAPGRVSAWYVFEDFTSADPDTPARPMRIGLRSFPRTYVNNMRSELSQASRGHTPGSTTFEGSGWKEREDGSARLTAFGHGYLAILGQPVTSLGDDNT